METKRKIILGVVALVLVALIVAAVVLWPLIVMGWNARSVKFTPYDSKTSGDRIHFLNTGGSDAMLIESGGKFALVDGAEDSDNPRGFEELVYKGSEQLVVEYIKKVAGDENGNVTLDFIVGTHAHSDHIGGLDTVVLDEAIKVNRLYIREYNAEIIKEYEREKWDNQEVYDQLIGACKTRGVEIVQDLSNKPFELGAFTITLKNTDDKSLPELIGENENSLGVLIEKGSMRAFLAGDINNIQGDEVRLGAEIGKVNLLKVGHHGYTDSTVQEFATALSPDVAVFTNTIHGMHKDVRKHLNSVNAGMIATRENNGIVAEFTNTEIVFYNEIH